MWTRDTCGFEPTNPLVKSVDLHIHLLRSVVSQNHNVVGGLAHPIYMQIYNILFYRCEILSSLLWLLILFDSIPCLGHRRRYMSPLVENAILCIFLRWSQLSFMIYSLYSAKNITKIITAQ